MRGRTCSSLTLRGNVETRLRKLEEDQYDAIMLAAAGLIRLGLEDRITHRFDAGAIRAGRRSGHHRHRMPRRRRTQHRARARTERRRSRGSAARPSARSRSDCRAAASRPSQGSRRISGERAAAARRHRLARRAARSIAARSSGAVADAGTQSASRLADQSARTPARGRCSNACARSSAVIPKVMPPLTELTVLVTRPAAQARGAVRRDHAAGRQRYRVSRGRDRAAA